MTQIIETVRQNAARLATLGGWPAWFDGEKSLVSRIPVDDDVPAPGFDAGIACALGLIPEEKQRLSAILHAAYTEEAVEQVRHEMQEMNADSETAWWLAACNTCKEGGMTTDTFRDQLNQFSFIQEDGRYRLECANWELEAMKKRFSLCDGVPFVFEDGGLQGAYILGYDWGVQYMPAYGIFFIGTFRPTLGLENFPFSTKLDGKGRPMSGPVHGSRQFVKCSTFEELTEAIKVVKAHFAS